MSFESLLVLLDSGRKQPLGLTSQIVEIPTYLIIVAYRAYLVTPRQRRIISKPLSHACCIGACCIKHILVYTVIRHRLGIIATATGVNKTLVQFILSWLKRVVTLLTEVYLSLIDYLGPCLSFLSLSLSLSYHLNWSASTSFTLAPATFQRCALSCFGKKGVWTGQCQRK